MRGFVWWGAVCTGLYIFETGLIWSTFFAVLGSGRERTAAVDAAFWATFVGQQLIVLGTALVYAKVTAVSQRRAAVMTAAALLLLALPTLFVVGFVTACSTQGSGCS